MTDNIAQALSFLLASDAADAARNVPAVVVTTTVASKVRAKVAKVEAPKVNPSTDKVEPLTMALPDKGSLDAKGFLVACRKAKTRDEVIQAIHAFFYEVRGESKIHTGYDPRKDFGSQEMVAKLLAQRELRGEAPKSTEYRRTTIPSTAGFVAGMPDHNRRMLQNLLAREKMTVEKREEYLALSRSAKLSDAERGLNAGLAQVEQARLEQIQADIAKF